MKERGAEFQKRWGKKAECPPGGKRNFVEREVSGTLPQERKKEEAKRKKKNYLHVRTDLKKVQKKKKKNKKKNYGGRVFLREEGAGC